MLTVQDYPTALYLHALFALRVPDLGCIEAIYCSHIVSWMGLIERRSADLVRDIASGGLASDLVLTTEERATLTGLTPPAPERYVFALGAVHFEFLPLCELDAASPRSVGLGALQTGQCYEVVITNHAGLYRYRLGDVVRIVDFAGSTPVFEFDQRRGNVLDLVGEKTTELHFRSAFNQLAREQLGGEAGLTDFTIWPGIGTVPYRYVAYAELSVRPTILSVSTLAARLDALLATENPSYATLGRANGRLDPVELRLVRPGTFEQLITLQREQAAGINANQVKVPKLLRNAEQRRLLEGAVAITE